MWTRRLAVILAGVFLVGLAGCFEKDAPGGGETKDETPKAPPGSEFHPRLLEIARTYRSYGEVDERMRWAPLPCAAPRFGPPPLLVSASKDQATHGRKIYSLFVNPPAYGNYVFQGKASPVGFVAVKESWVPEVVRAGETRPDRQAPGPNGAMYRPTKQADLFVMYKMDPRTPGTDEGWVYGTVTADGKTVTSAGRVASCMACHVSAPQDRLFGLPKE